MSYEHFKKNLKGKPIYSPDRRRFQRDHDEDVQSRQPRNKQQPNLLKNLIKSKWLLLSGLIAIAFCLLALEFSIPILAKHIIDLSYDGASKLSVHVLGLLGIGLVLLSGLCRFSKAMFQAKVLLWCSSKLRLDLLKHILSFPYFSFREFPVGGLTSGLRNDVDATANMVIESFVKPFLAVVRVIGSVVLLFYFQWKIGIALVFLLGSLFLFYIVVMRTVGKIFQSINENRRRLDSRVVEILSGIRFVKEFKQERKVLADYAADQNLLLRKQKYVRGLQALQDASWETIYGIINVGIVWIGCILVLDGHATLGDVVLCQLYGSSLFPPMWELISAHQSYHNSAAALQNLREISSVKTNTFTASGLLPTPQVISSLEFRNISFNYTKHRKVIASFNLKVKAGEVTAIIGPSGGGKSTILDLASRLIEPDSGNILINGKDIRLFSMDSYRKMVKGMHQRQFVFAGTIADNIALELHPDLNRLEEASQMADALSFIQNLPNKFNTYLSEGGIGLSGGQIQRICLARVFYSQPRVFLLDEATSDLDVDSERRILNNLRSISDGKIIVIATHRIEALSQSDTVFTIVNGQLFDQKNNLSPDRPSMS